MPHTKGEIEELRMLVQKNEDSVKNLSEMVEHLASLVAAWGEKNRPGSTTGAPRHKKAPKAK